MQSRTENTVLSTCSTFFRKQREKRYTITDPSQFIEKVNAMPEASSVVKPEHAKWLKMATIGSSLIFSIPYATLFWIDGGIMGGRLGPGGAYSLALLGFVTHWVLFTQSNSDELFDMFNRHYKHKPRLLFEIPAISGTIAMAIAINDAMQHTPDNLGGPTPVGWRSLFIIATIISRYLLNKFAQKMLYYQLVGEGLMTTKLRMWALNYLNEQLTNRYRLQPKDLQSLADGHLIQLPSWHPIVTAIITPFAMSILITVFGVTQSSVVKWIIDENANDLTAIILANILAVFIALLIEPSTIAIQLFSIFSSSRAMGEVVYGQPILPITPKITIAERICRILLQIIAIVLGYLTSLTTVQLTKDYVTGTKADWFAYETAIGAALVLGVPMYQFLSWICQKPLSYCHTRQAVEESVPSDVYREMANVAQMSMTEVKAYLLAEARKQLVSGSEDDDEPIDFAYFVSTSRSPSPVAQI